ncbi:MAG: YbaB/EbfC family nucleoid-associated protein [Geminicoccaceae bacterium]|nr:YbaB/EbfC family nucleoid-associated protein [Geminicoccaceae bacterium]MCB2009340.1 YbaB/EbfC family nucleoid-associated protein [Geminicoccaceae bacterium]
MKNLTGMLKQAQKMQQQMQEMQTRLDGMEVEGEAGAGMLRVTLNGKGEMRRVKIDPQLVDPDDIETLEDLIVAATNNAKQRVEEHMQSEMSKMTGGLQLPPGMKLPF